jgi:hypothetical protein
MTGHTGPLGIEAPPVRLAAGVKPWPESWEFRPGIDDCDHQWQIAVVTSADTIVSEAVVRCVDCFSPRCGSSVNRDPCMLRRHHEHNHLPWGAWVRTRLPEALDRESVERWLDA